MAEPDRRRVAAEVRVAFWGLVIGMAVNVALLAYSYGDLHRMVTETHEIVKDISHELRVHDHRIQSLEDMPEHRHRLEIGPPAPASPEDARVTQ